MSSTCDRVVFVEEVPSRLFTAEYGEPIAVVAPSERVHCMFGIQQKTRATHVPEQINVGERPKM
jgi:hypothetical protein